MGHPCPNIRFSGIKCRDRKITERRCDLFFLSEFGRLLIGGWVVRQPPDDHAGSVARITLTCSLAGMSNRDPICRGRMLGVASADRQTETTRMWLIRHNPGRAARHIGGTGWVLGRLAVKKRGPSNHAAGLWSHNGRSPEGPRLGRGAARSLLVVE